VNHRAGRTTDQEPLLLAQSARRGALPMILKVADAGSRSGACVLLAGLAFVKAASSSGAAQFFLIAAACVLLMVVWAAARGWRS
jgi:hypothetical protein